MLEYFIKGVWPSRVSIQMPLVSEIATARMDLTSDLSPIE